MYQWCANEIHSRFFLSIAASRWSSHTSTLRRILSKTERRLIWQLRQSNKYLCMYYSLPAKFFSNGGIMDARKWNNECRKVCNNLTTCTNMSFASKIGITLSTETEVLIQKWFGATRFALLYPMAIALQKHGGRERIGQSDQEQMMHYWTLFLFRYLWMVGCYFVHALDGRIFFRWKCWLWVTLFECSPLRSIHRENRKLVFDSGHAEWIELRCGKIKYTFDCAE